MLLGDVLHARSLGLLVSGATKAQARAKRFIIHYQQNRPLRKGASASDPPLLSAIKAPRPLLCCPAQSNAVCCEKKSLAHARCALLACVCAPQVASDAAPSGGGASSVGACDAMLGAAYRAGAAQFDDLLGWQVCTNPPL